MKWKEIILKLILATFIIGAVYFLSENDIGAIKLLIVWLFVNEIRKL